MMLISVFYQLLLVIVDPILLGGLKMGDDVLDHLVLEAIFVGHCEYGDFLLDDIHR